jgi:hypothetical protein
MMGDIRLLDRLIGELGRSLDEPVLGNQAIPADERVHLERALACLLHARRLRQQRWAQTDRRVGPRCGW